MYLFLRHGVYSSNTFTGFKNHVQQRTVMYGANITTHISFEIHCYTVDIPFRTTPGRNQTSCQIN
jgi:hypothetical protein